MKGVDGRTPLMLAALLPSDNDDAGRRRDDSNKALVKAARDGHASYLRALLAKGASPDTRDENGWTPLIHASAAGHDEIVQFLLQSGAAPNARTSNGLTAATLAIGARPRADRAHALRRGARRRPASAHAALSDARVTRPLGHAHR